MARKLRMTRNTIYVITGILSWLLIKVQKLVLYITGRIKHNRINGQPLHVFKAYKACQIMHLPTCYDFFSLHHSFASLDYLLKDNVCIYAMDPSFAYFIEVPENVNIYSSETITGIMNAQFEHAQRIIHVPIQDFLKFSISLKSDLSKVVYVANHGRCGSTILTQMFEKTRNFTTLDEPGLVHHLCNEPDLQTEEIVRAVFSCLAKPMSNMPTDFLIKPASYGLSLVPVISKYIPEIKKIFLYREGKPTLDSFLRAIFLNENMGTPKSLDDLIDTMMAIPLRRNVFYGTPGMRLMQSRTSFLTWMWASSLRFYKEYINSNIEITAVKYEDLIKSPASVFTEILEWIEHPTDCDDAGLTALKKDSQRGLNYSRNKSHTNSSTVLPEYDYPEVKAQCDAICDYLHVPRLDQACLLPASLTGQTKL